MCVAVHRIPGFGSRPSQDYQTAKMTISRPSIANSLLAALPHRDYKKLLPELEPVTLTFGETMYDPGAQIRHVYFPCDSLISLLTIVEGHLALEVGLIGREGMLGVSLALGINVSPVRALVQGTGTALRMKANRFLQEFRSSPALQREIFRYTHTLMAQITQTAACNRFHVVEARLARWLLMTRDRVQSNEFRLTQEFLAHMLGVRRVGVTKAASALHRQGLISYSRGNITILDGKRLAAACCTCYEIVKDMHDGARGEPGKFGKTKPGTGSPLPGSRIQHRSVSGVPPQEVPEPA
jgi:CRP-like cAMP-binding protein